MTVPVSVLIASNIIDQQLQQALSSIAVQSPGVAEVVIVVNGGARSSALPTISGLSLKVVERAESGLAAALAAGLVACTQPFVARLDADDVAEPHRVGRQYAAFTGRPHLGVLGSGALLIDAHGGVVGIRRATSGSSSNARRLLRRNVLMHPSVMMRRQAVIECGNYNCQLTTFEDYELWLRLVAKGWEVDNLEEPLLRYRLHPGQMSRKRPSAKVLQAVTKAQKEAARQLEIPSANMLIGSWLWRMRQRFVPSRSRVNALYLMFGRAR